MIYRIKNWDDHFENDRSRRVDNCSFVCVPNKQHGIGFSYIMQEPDGLVIYGVWCLLLGLCSQQKNPRKGWLTIDGKKTGIPLTPVDIALKFRREESEVQRALDFICSPAVGWIESFETSDLSRVSDDSPRTHHALTIGSPQTHIEGREGKKERRKEVDLIPIPSILNSKEFLSAWEDWKNHREEIKHPLTPTTVKKQLAAMVKIGVVRAVVAVNYSIEKGWQGIYEPKTFSSAPVKKRIAV